MSTMQPCYFELPKLPNERWTLRLCGWHVKACGDRRWVGHATVKGRAFVWESMEHRRLPADFIEWFTGGLSRAEFDALSTGPTLDRGGHHPVERDLGLEAARLMIAARLADPHALSGLTRSVLKSVVIIGHESASSFRRAHAAQLAELERNIIR